LLLNAGADDYAVTSLTEFLAQYPQDRRFTPIAEALRRHKTGR
jgi:hypothetical protein